MSDFAFLRQCSTSGAAFESATLLLRLARLWHDSDGAIAHWVGPSGWTDARGAFSRASDFVEQRRCGTSRLTVIVDEVNPYELNPLSGGNWSSLIAMLILSFPDVQWLFLTITDHPTEDVLEHRKRWNRFAATHGISCVGDKRGSPLFDGHGLRRWIMTTIKEEAKLRATAVSSNHASALPERQKLATVLDEEPDFHLFLAHMAYSRGFRVHSIASWSEADALLGENGVLTKENTSDFCLSLEDWFLSFPDQTTRQMSDLEERSLELPCLSQNPPPLRRFLSVGHQQQPERSKTRLKYLKDLRHDEWLTTGKKINRETQLIYKPASGFYTLWRNLGMLSALRRTGEPDNYHGLAEGFRWPPVEPKNEIENDFEGHSSPGRLLQIAENLLTRANAIIDNVNTVREAVRGAVLSTQALELLGCKTPTVSVDALLLKHEFEVAAECQFVGVEFHLSMNERLLDIRKNLKAMSLWLHSSRRDEFMLNAEAKIVTRLIAKLDEYGEYEESQTCQGRLRSLHHRVVHRKELRTSPIFAMLCWPFRAYIEFVLRSLRHFAAALVILTMIFTCLFMVMLSKTFLDGLHSTMLAVFTVSFGDASPPLAERVICYMTAATGVLNFGLLVTYLYSKMVRK